MKKVIFVVCLVLSAQVGFASTKTIGGTPGSYWVLSSGSDFNSCDQQKTVMKERLVNGNRIIINEQLCYETRSLEGTVVFQGGWEILR